MVGQTTVSDPDSWIFDSGCSSHCTGDRTQFTNLRPHSGTLTIADGTKLAITGKGTIQLNYRLSSGNVTPATLYDVLLVPDLGMNRLFSWTTVSRKGFKMTGLAEDIKLMDKNGKEVLWAKRDGSNQNVIQVVNDTANLVSFYSCHKALEYSTASTIKTAINNNQYTNEYNLLLTSSNFNCTQ